MATDFASNLQAHLEAHPEIKRPRLKRVLAAPDSPHRTRVLARIEAHVAIHFDDKVTRDAAGVIDWSAIDWPALLAQIVAFIEKILPLILTILTLL